MVTLLLHHVRFALPFPDEQLALFAGAQRDPLSLHVNANCVDLVLSDLERMDWLEVIKVVNAENTVGLTYN